MTRLTHALVALFLFAAVAPLDGTSMLAVANGKGEAGREPHAEHLLKCAKTCADCQVECDACFKHCHTLLAQGKKEHAKTAQMCADCAECCKACATLCARQSPLARHMLICCAQCCDDCAAQCETVPSDKHMAACAKTCRDCAKECRAMLKHFGN